MEANYIMEEKAGLCEICRIAAVHLPGTSTVIGQMDLCIRCYWRYCELVHTIAATLNTHLEPPQMKGESR